VEFGCNPRWAALFNRRSLNGNRFLPVLSQSFTQIINRWGVVFLEEFIGDFPTHLLVDTGLLDHFLIGSIAIESGLESFHVFRLRFDDAVNFAFRRRRKPMFA